MLFNVFNYRTLSCERYWRYAVKNPADTTMIPPIIVPISEQTSLPPPLDARLLSASQPQPLQTHAHPPFVQPTHFVLFSCNSNHFLRLVDNMSYPYALSRLVYVYHTWRACVQSVAHISYLILLCVSVIFDYPQSFYSSHRHYK